jgi:hypothetical protein
MTIQRIMLCCRLQKLNQRRDPMQKEIKIRNGIKNQSSSGQHEHLVIPQKLPKPKRQCIRCGKFVTQKDGKPFPHFGIGEERHCYCTGSFAKHPEDCCQRCRQPNITWFAPSELWNKVTGNKGGLILCPVCFAKQAEKIMPNAIWKFEPEK